MVKYFTVPIIDRRFLLVTPPSNVLKAAIKHEMGKILIDKIKKDPVDKGMEGCCYVDQERGRIVMWLKTKNSSVITHEVDHAIFYMFKAIGAASEPEFRAYTHEWLFDKIKNILR